MKYKKIFISGTNTEVGKTFISENIIKMFELKGIMVSPFKPIETGCRMKSSKLLPHDSTIFFKAIQKRLSLDQINPYRFIEPISPAAAIKRSRRKITISQFSHMVIFVINQS